MDSSQTNNKKKPLAFLLGITGNLAFAAGNVALAINKHMPQGGYDIVIYYTDLLPQDIAAFQQIPNVRLVPFDFPETFKKKMLAALPRESRFSDVRRFMTFSHFEVFSLLNEYRYAAWIDADISVQNDIGGIINYGPFGITIDGDFAVQKNFSRPIAGYDMSIPGCCAAVIVVSDELPFERMHKWCYEKSIEYADALINADQAIINIALQEFGIKPNLMSDEEWQCSPSKDAAITAKIVHFGWVDKVWNTVNICNAFPEWYRTHLAWLQLGGSDFDQSKINPRTILTDLNDIANLRKNIENLHHDMEKLHHERLGVIRSLYLSAQDFYMSFGLQLAAPDTLKFRIHQTLKKIVKIVKKTVVKTATTNNVNCNNEQNVCVSLHMSAGDAVLLVNIMGGIGDYIVSARYLRDLFESVGHLECHIYCHHTNLAKWLLSDYANVQKYIKDNEVGWEDLRNRYPMSLCLLHSMDVQIHDEGKVSKFSHKMIEVYKHINLSNEYFKPFIPMDTNHHNENPYVHKAVLNDMHVYDIYQKISGIPYGGDKLNLSLPNQILSKFNLTGRFYITVNNGIHEGFKDKYPGHGKLSTKTYREFSKVLSYIKVHFPSIYVVQIGAATSQKIEGVDLYLLNETTLEEAAAVLSGSQLHIDSEGGLVHLARCLGVTSCVVFGPTSYEYFAYPQNVNIEPSYCGNCFCLTKDWRERCARGFSEPECLIRTPAKLIADKVVAYLNTSKEPINYTCAAV